MKQIFFHDAAIDAYREEFPLDADYTTWYARFHLLRVDAETNYNDFYSVEDSQVSQTLNVDLQLKGIKGKTGKARDKH